MNDHEWLQENLDAFLAGGLSTDERLRIEQHTAACPACGQALAESRQWEQAMDRLFTNVRPNADLEARTIRKLRAKRVSRASLWRFAAAAAAVVFFGGVGFVVEEVTGGSPRVLVTKMGYDNGAEGNSYFSLVHGTTHHGENFRGKESSVALLVDASGSMAAVDDVPVDYNFRATNRDKEWFAERVKGLTSIQRYSESQGRQAAVDSFSSLQALGDSKEKAGKSVEELNQLAESYYYRNQATDTKQKMKVQEGQYDTHLGSAATMADPTKGQGANEPTFHKRTADKLGGIVSGLSADGTVTPDLKRPIIIVNDGAPVMERQSVIPMDLSGSMRFQSHPDKQGYFKPSEAQAKADPKSYFPAAMALAPPGVPKNEPKKENSPKEKNGEDQAPDGADKPNNVVGAKLAQPKIEEKKIEPDSGLKIIRTGEMEFEVESFDGAVKAIATLVKGIKGGFKLKEDSNKQENGKTRGFVVVRVPPQELDQFVLDLRRDLGKMGELKTQRIGSQDVTKQFTDTESELRAARAVEGRLVEIIKTGKGEIKDLIAAERELGIWRTKIEKMEGEIRYYSNQVSLSTLTINLVEKEIMAASALVVTGKLMMRIEVEEVTKARQAAEKAVEEMKGRLTRSDEKQHAAGQIEAILHADIPPAKKDEFRDLLKKLGLVSAHEEMQSQTTEGGSGRAIDRKPRVSDVKFEVTLNNTVNVRPRHSVDLALVSTDVAAHYAKLQDAILRVAKGQIRDAKLNEHDKQRLTAVIDFNVPSDQKQAIDKVIAEIGPVLKRTNTQAAVTEVSTEQKFGYSISLHSIATVEPREKVKLHIEVKDVEKKSAELIESTRAVKGQAHKVKSGLNSKGQMNALLVMNVPLTASDSLVRQFKEGVKVVDWDQTPNPQIPDNELATAQIIVVLTGGSPIVPNDENLGGYISSSLTTSYMIFARCLMVIIIGISAVLPVLIVFGIGYWVVRKIWPAAEEQAAGSGQQAAGSSTPPTP